MRLLLATILFLWACGNADNAPKDVMPIPDRLNELGEKADLYLSLQAGWLPGCDSLLFSSLTAVGGADIDIMQARDDQGRWYRTPGHDCYPDRSKSTISKDMLIGMLWWAWKMERADVIQQLMDDHRPGYVMGEGPLSRTLMTPSLQGLYARALLNLGGKAYEPEMWYPQIYTDTEGFEAHLQILGILLDCKTTGTIDAKAFAVIKRHYDRNPRNAFFAFAYHLFYTGDLNEPVNILLDDPAWPSDRLPGSEDRCEPWVIQRELGHDWEPCDEGLTHSGGELLFIYKLIQDEQ